MRLKRNPVRNIRSRTAICSRGLVPPGDFPPDDFLAVDLQEEDMIVVVGWVKERKFTRIIIKVGRLKD
jgi:hypothetical protein